MSAHPRPPTLDDDFGNARHHELSRAHEFIPREALEFGEERLHHRALHTELANKVRGEVPLRDPKTPLGPVPFLPTDLHQGNPGPTGHRLGSQRELGVAEADGHLTTGEHAERRSEDHVAQVVPVL